MSNSKVLILMVTGVSIVLVLAFLAWKTVLSKPTITSNLINTKASLTPSGEKYLRQKFPWKQVVIIFTSLPLIDQPLTTKNSMVGATETFAEFFAVESTLTVTITVHINETEVRKMLQNETEYKHILGMQVYQAVEEINSPPPISHTQLQFLRDNYVNLYLENPLLIADLL